MSLATLLAGARARRTGRLREHKEKQRQQARASGKPVRESRGEVVEKVTSALFARDFLNDLDRLLIARGAQLCLSWRGKRAQLYIASGSPASPTIEVLMQARRNNPSVLGCYEGEIGRRILALMQQHQHMQGRAMRLLGMLGQQLQKMNFPVLRMIGGVFKQLAQLIDLDQKARAILGRPQGLHPAHQGHDLIQRRARLRSGAHVANQGGR